jgi:DNA primase
MRVEHEMSRRTDQDIEVQTAVVFTHTDKILFPEAGSTKGEVLSFYERISERLLPHLRDRPVTLERFPEGVTDTAAPHFWQKHTPSYYPAWIPQSVAPCMPPLKPSSEFSTLSACQSASAVSHLPQGYLITEFASANACRIVRDVQPTPCAVGHLAVRHGKGRYRLCP